MSDSDLVVVFDLLDAGFKEWTFPAFGLIFVAAGFLMVRFPQTVMQLTNWTSRPRLYKYFSRFFFGFAIFWILFSFAGTYGSYLALRGAYTDGRFEVVEGPVEDFRPMPASGKQREHFMVAGQRFSYSDYKVIPGFSTSRSHGSPIGAGVYVRISHVNDEIVRLEVERSAVEAAKDRPARSVKITNNLFKGLKEGTPGALLIRYFWVFFLFGIVANAAIWRWRGRAYIARDPSLRQGYNRMALGLAFWSGLPVLVMALASIFEGMHLFEIVSLFASWSFWPVLFQIVLGVVHAKWVYWTFFQNGAAKMAQHPGLIDHEWVAKVWPSVFAAGYLISLMRSLF